MLAMDELKLHPIGGIDYPQTLQEFDKWFATEDGCIHYLIRLRWPQGFQCPRCGSKESWRTERGLLHCKHCNHQTSLTAGTIFQGTRKPLRVWFQAMWYVTNQKFGVSALGLKRVLGLGSYQTAWTWLHKLRHAMVRPGRDMLKGHVEVDETYVGGEEKGTYGRKTKTKSIVAIAIEVHSPKGFGRVRLKQIPDVTGPTLIGFVKDVVEAGSIVETDGWGGYNDLPMHGYEHVKRILSKSQDPDRVVLPGPHRIASLLKRWLLGTHQGAVRYEHLDYYLDEYTFRFNRRSSKARGLLFHRLVEQAVQIMPSTYEGIKGGTTNRVRTSPLHVT
jgi:transposase-like protein